MGERLLGPSSLRPARPAKAPLLGAHASPLPGRSVLPLERQPGVVSLAPPSRETCPHTLGPGLDVGAAC